MLLLLLPSSPWTIIDSQFYVTGIRRFFPHKSETELLIAHAEAGDLV